MNRPARIVNCDSVCCAKLRSERGASIILALVLFLICAMVAGVIVSGASVNVERTTQEVAEEQAYLDLRSAGQAVQALFNPADGTAGSEVSLNLTDPANPDFHGNSLMQTGGKGADVADWVVRNAQQVRSTGLPINGVSNPWVTSITSTSPYSLEETNEVKVAFWMGTKDSDPNNYNINALLSVSDPSNNATQIEVVVIPSMAGTATNPILTWSRSDLYKVVE